ncbi:hypothetical protein [Roseovarius sp. 2305UL8-3]|uniref:hypothetical protein n=1 Tax=Roseovarius conchicola TaxID=3121636 RepID=UPI0035298F8A
MTRLIFRIAVLMALAGCAGPQGDDLMGAGRSTDAEAAILAEPVAEAPVEAAPVTPDTSCDDPGDGIGGTGCSVD